MKKNILIFITVLTALSLTAFSVFNWNESETKEADTAGDKAALESPIVEDVNDMVYNPVFEEPTKKNIPEFFLGVGPRFNSIKKEDVNKLRSFSDLIGNEHAQRIVSYKSLSVIVLEDDKHTDKKLSGNSGDFSEEQIKFLQSFDYSTNLLIWADYKEKNIETGIVEDSYWTPYLTIVPETQAVYEKGNEAFINYLREFSTNETDKVNLDRVQPGKLYITISKDGTISKVNLYSTSGFSEVDERLIELISKAPGKWIPAKNANGENVDQELVISFGNMGC